MILVLILIILILLLITSKNITEGFNQNEIFKEENGSDYRGRQNKTLSGRKCQKWTSKVPHKHSFTSGYENMGVSDHNYCRNPDNSESIWCYTNDPNKPREYCEPLKIENFNKNINLNTNNTNGKNNNLSKVGLEKKLSKSCMTQIEKDYVHKTKLLPESFFKNYIHKTKIKPCSCPKCPDMSKYVLKSSVSCH